MVKNLPANAGDIRDVGLIPGSWRSPGGGHGNPFHYSWLENPHGQRNQAGYIVHRVTKSQILLKRLSTHTHGFVGEKYCLIPPTTGILNPRNSYDLKNLPYSCVGCLLFYIVYWSVIHFILFKLRFSLA